VIGEHRFASTRLCSYRDQALPMGAERRVRAHLSDCPRCRESLVELTAFAVLLRTSKAPAPEGLADRVIAHLDAAESTAARLSVVACPADTAASRSAAVAAAWSFVRGHLRRTLVLAFLTGLAITLIKDLGTLVGEGVTVETCAVCGANFIAAFALLNVGLLLARPRGRPR